jgi:hypothetical protein
VIMGGANPAPPDTASSEIVVRGLTEKDARAVAGKFTHSEADGPIARWHNWLCFSVQGLAPDQSKMLMSRIQHNAADVGIRTIDDKACTWNVLIGFAADADAFANKLVKDHPGLFRDYYRTGLASRHERDVLAAPRPVRWLAVERAVAGVGSGASTEEASQIPDASHISTNVRGDKFAELVIVDPQRVSGLSWQQLEDYLSMVILTDPSMDGTFTDDRSIMSLFAARDRGEPGPPGLTEEDRQILRGYYAFDPYLPPARQVDMIVTSLKTPAPVTGDDHTPR